MLPNRRKCHFIFIHFIRAHRFHFLKGKVAASSYHSYSERLSGYPFYPICWAESRANIILRSYFSLSLFVNIFIQQTKSSQAYSCFYSQFCHNFLTVSFDGIRSNIHHFCDILNAILFSH